MNRACLTQLHDESSNVVHRQPHAHENSKASDALRASLARRPRSPPYILLEMIAVLDNLASEMETTGRVRSRPLPSCSIIAEGEEAPFPPNPSTT